MAAHNGLAGIGIVFSADGDYHAVVVRPVADAARAGDLLLTTNRKLTRYVLQETPLEVRNVSFFGPPRDEDVTARARVFSRTPAGTIYVIEGTAAAP